MTGNAAPSSNDSFLGSGRRLLRGHRDQLRLAVEAGAGDHPIADLVRVDPLPHRLDLARDLVADDAGELGRVRVQADPGQRVGEVDPGGLDGDPHLAGPDRRVGPLLDLQGPRAARAG